MLTVDSQGGVSAWITQHLYCKYLQLLTYQRVRIWEQFLQLESQLELCQNLRQLDATEAVKFLHFSFKLLFLALQNSFVGPLVTQSLSQLTKLKK